MSGLHGERCIVLRPPPEGESVCRQLGALGLEVLHLPTLAITPLPATPPPAESPTLLVFISQNAVRHGAWLLPAHPEARVAAIGAGTARALAAAGRPADIVPGDGGYDSEALLAQPAMADPAGMTVWIIRGRGGRGLLGDTLRTRGATVRYLEVYERRLPAPDPAALATAKRWLAATPPPWLVATSVESLENLARMLPTTALGYRLVTASDRVVKLAETRDRVALVLRAGAPDPASLGARLQSWAEARSADPDSA